MCIVYYNRKKQTAQTSVSVCVCELSSTGFPPPLRHIMPEGVRLPPPRFLHII